MRELLTPSSVILIGLITLLGGLTLNACSNFADPQELRALVQTGAKLIDVRTPREYAAGHIEGAMNIPVNEVMKRLKELGALDQPIVVYCRSGKRSGRARAILKTQGFSRVYNLGGIGRWPK